METDRKPAQPHPSQQHSTALPDPSSAQAQFSPQQQRALDGVKTTFHSGLTDSARLEPRDVRNFLEGISDTLGRQVSQGDFPVAVKDQLMTEFKETAGWHPREKRPLVMPLRKEGVLQCFKNCLKLLGVEISLADVRGGGAGGGGGGGGGRLSYLPPGAGNDGNAEGSGGGGGSWRSAGPGQRGGNDRGRPKALDLQQGRSRAAEPEPSGPVEAVDQATLERKLRGTWSELVFTKDIKEAVECCKEFAHPDHNAAVCKRLVIDKLLEAKSSALPEQIELLCKLLEALLNSSVMKKEELEAGYVPVCG